MQKFCPWRQCWAATVTPEKCLKLLCWYLAGKQSCCSWRDSHWLSLAVALHSPCNSWPDTAFMSRGLLEVFAGFLSEHSQENPLLALCLFSFTGYKEKSWHRWDRCGNICLNPRMPPQEQGLGVNWVSTAPAAKARKGEAGRAILTQAMVAAHLVSNLFAIKCQAAFVSA